MNNKIIIQLYTESKYKKLTKNICSKYGYQYAEDLHSEVVIKIIEKGDNLLEIKDLFHYFFAFAYRTINEYKISKKYGYNFNRVDSNNLSTENIGSLAAFSYELLPSDLLYTLLEPSRNDTFRDDYKKEFLKTITTNLRDGGIKTNLRNGKNVGTFIRRYNVYKSHYYRSFAIIFC